MLININGQHNYSSSEEFYKKQCETFATHLLLSDNNMLLPIEEISLNLTPDPFTSRIPSIQYWPNYGQLIAGSYVASITTGGCLPYGDIDIYFKSCADVQNFVSLNALKMINEVSEEFVCSYTVVDGIKLNLIWGIKFDGPNDLLSAFDIRCCAIAYCPVDKKLFQVEGCVNDIATKQIVFNPCPRGTTINRLVKYIEKGYKIDKYQRLFFAELIRSEKYNPILEATTGYKGE
jgi:hypothetical protein